MKIKAIIFGSTGMVGEGVLFECLRNSEVEEVLVINRHLVGISHPKLKECVHADFFNLAPIETQLSGYNACYFCLGISSFGISKEEYKHITYDLTFYIGQLLAKINPDMTFYYVSGAGTDSSEHGRLTWARVKGRTENDLMHMFKNSYMFRPAFMRASPGQKNLKLSYKLLAWIYPVGRAIYPAGFCTLREVGQAMINATFEGYSKQIIDVKDIIKLAKKR